MKSFIAKRVISILVNLRYLRFKLLKYKENNKNICNSNTFDHNFKNIPLYIMSNASLERYYFVLYDGALTLKMSKMALNAFCDKTLHIFHTILAFIMSTEQLHIALSLRNKNIPTTCKSHYLRTFIGRAQSMLFNRPVYYINIFKFYAYFCNKLKACPRFAWHSNNKCINMQSGFQVL